MPTESPNTSDSTSGSPGSWQREKSCERISIFGIGRVGTVLAACLAEDGHSVVAVDVNADKVARLNEGRSPIVEPDLEKLISTGVTGGRLCATTNSAVALAATDVSVICVGTPSKPNGELDLSLIAGVCAEIGQELRVRTVFHIVVVRSTVLPSSTSQVLIPILEASSGKRAGIDFGVAMCPEFLREGTAIRDHRETSVHVLGVTDAQTEMRVRGILANRVGSVVLTDTRVAELVKYANNAWHATKVVFANEIGALSKAMGIDGAVVMDLLCADTRLNISRNYMSPGFAFGGSCLPKDVRALTHAARAHDVATPMLEALLVSNRRHIERACGLVESAGNRKVGLVGLSFKPDTDDMRESPSVALAELLLGKGFDLMIFDQNVCLADLYGDNRSFIGANLPHLERLLADDLDAVVQHADTLVIAHADTADGRKLPSIRQGQTVIDLGHAAWPKMGMAHMSGSLGALAHINKYTAPNSSVVKRIEAIDLESGNGALRLSSLSEADDGEGGSLHI